MEELKSSLTTKSNLNQSINRDEHHTLFTKLLADSSISDKTDIGHCIENVNKTDADPSICSLNDFTGGPICDDQSFDVKTKAYSCDDDTNFNRAITTTPADSSGGFHNTLSVLEYHLNKNKYPNHSQRYLDYQKFQSKDVAGSTNICVDIPINTDHGLLSIDHSTTNVKNDSHIDDEKISCLFDLELEAIERLHSMWAMPPQNYESPVLTAALPPLLSKQSEDNVPKSNEYIYHVARSRSGQLYLRVRRSLHLDQGI